MSNPVTIYHSRSKASSEEINIREILLNKSPQDLSRELPGLIDEINSPSEDFGEIIRYAVGVSFSKNGSCFDYWINASIAIEGRDDHQTHSMKDPVTSTHNYVTFFYPPDPHFNAQTLRAVLLAAIEEQNVSFSEVDPKANHDVKYRILNTLYAFKRRLV